MDKIYLNNLKYLNLLNINYSTKSFLKLALFAGSTIKKIKQIWNENRKYYRECILLFLSRS